MAEVSVAPAAARLVTPDREGVVQRLLHAARQHVGLPIAFISEFMEGQRVFRYVDTDTGAALVEVGGSDPVEESYCYYVANGSLPEFLRDPMEHPVSASLPATAALGVGTHLSVPIRLPNGSVYGTFCCFSLEVDRRLAERDLEVVRMLAELATDYIAALEAEESEHRSQLERIRRVLDDPAGITMVFQPLVDIAYSEIFGVEALARFPTENEPPDRMFAAAWQVGLGIELELKAVRAALDQLDQLPSHMRMSVNASPLTVVTDDFLSAVEEVPPGRLTVEVTEHAAVDDYQALRAARRRLSARGIRLAIDDVGMGFSGLNHILESAPDTLKIDRAVVHGVADNPAKTAMIKALVSFATGLNILVIAEGIETEEELAALRAAGVSGGQGYYLGRPADLASAVAYAA